MGIIFKCFLFIFCDGTFHCVFIAKISKILHFHFLPFFNPLTILDQIRPTHFCLSIWILSRDPVPLNHRNFLNMFSVASNYSFWEILIVQKKCAPGRFKFFSQQMTIKYGNYTAWKHIYYMYEYSTFCKLNHPPRAAYCMNVTCTYLKIKPAVAKFLRCQYPFHKWCKMAEGK